MSILKKVITAVKKFLKATAKRRRPYKKRLLMASSKKVQQAKPVRRVAKIKPTPKASKNLKKKSAQVLKKVAPKANSASPEKTGVLAGEVTHYFDRIKVCVIRIDRGHIKKGDRILIKGVKGELRQTVTSLQIENEDVALGKKGQMIGLKVTKPVFVKDGVFKT